MLHSALTRACGARRTARGRDLAGRAHARLPLPGLLAQGAQTGQLCRAGSCRLSLSFSSLPVVLTPGTSLGGSSGDTCGGSYIPMGSLDPVL